MPRLKIDFDYDEYESNEKKPHKKKMRERESNFKMKFKPNKRAKKNLDFRTEKDSNENASIIENMLNQISAPSTGYKGQTEGTVVKNDASILVNKPLSSFSRSERADPEEICKMLGLKFSTTDEMVLMLFNAPLSLPWGCVFHIKDAYINCDCELVQVLNKMRLMYVFKKLPAGSITTYTVVSLKDADEITYVGRRKDIESKGKSNGSKTVRTTV